MLARTDPKDVARVEKCTYMCTPEKRQTCPEPAPGVEGRLANWVSPDDLQTQLDERFPGCMKGERQRVACTNCFLSTSFYEVYYHYEKLES